ncbi:MAG: DUF192 domain-containing protein [bacterium]|nr:MAG: DUF192 domain-containing protein [bacterium]
MAVRNRTRNTYLANTLLNFNPYYRETLGHLNRRGIPNGCALWISPCQSIFTVGLKGPIDIVFIDRSGVVVKVLSNFPPNCLATASTNAASVLELPPRTIQKSGTKKGDVLDLDPS